MPTRQTDPCAGPIRLKGGAAVGDLATYQILNGASVKLRILAIERDGDYLRLRARVTSPTRHGYDRGEILTLRDSAYITYRPRAGEPPLAIVLDAMRSAGRTFVWHDYYGAGWTRWDRPPANAPFWIVNGASAREEN